MSATTILLNNVNYKTQKRELSDMRVTNRDELINAIKGIINKYLKFQKDVSFDKLCLSKAKSGDSWIYHIEPLNHTLKMRWGGNGCDPVMVFVCDDIIELEETIHDMMKDKAICMEFNYSKKL